MAVFKSATYAGLDGWLRSLCKRRHLAPVSPADL